MSETIELKHNSNATTWAESPDRIKVFSVQRETPEFATWNATPHENGEEFQGVRYTVQDYTMPAHPNAGLALAYLKRARENADIAASWLLELAIGSEGYDALTEELGNEPDPEVALATQRNVIAFVAQRALGALQGKA